MKRIFISKNKKYDKENTALLNEINFALDLDVLGVKIYSGYEFENLPGKHFEIIQNNIIYNELTDNITQFFDHTKNHVAWSVLPKQFDPIRDSIRQCSKLFLSKAPDQIKTFKVVELLGEISKDELKLIKQYLIDNKQNKEKILDTHYVEELPKVKELYELEGFRENSDWALSKLIEEYNLTIDFDLLLSLREYFIKENRDPNITELIAIDRFYSKYTMSGIYTTKVNKIDNKSTYLKDEIDQTVKSFTNYTNTQGKENNFKNIVEANYDNLKSSGKLNEVVKANGVEGFSFYDDVNVNGTMNKYLIAFKSGTLNEYMKEKPSIASGSNLSRILSTVISHKAKPYQAIRISSSNYDTSKTNREQSKTIKKMIQSAKGSSSYANRFGIATTLTDEVFHKDFNRVQFDVSAVIGAALASHAVKEKITEGDKLILVGWKTNGIPDDGETNKINIDGNPDIKRRIGSLFGSKYLCRTVKAAGFVLHGGLLSAITYLSDSTEVNLNNVKTDSNYMNGMEIALSESQERLVLAVKPQDVDYVIEYLKNKDLEANEIGSVTNDGRTKMFWNQDSVFDIETSFFKNYKSKREMDVIIPNQEPVNRVIEGENFKDKFINNFYDLNVSSKIGISALFDSSKGTTTVFKPYGGTEQKSRVNVSVQKLPVLSGGETDKSTFLAYGIDPNMSVLSPFLQGIWAVVESVNKIVTHGAKLDSIKLSVQHSLGDLAKDEIKWGKSYVSLLGAYRSMNELGLASLYHQHEISYNDEKERNALISFALGTGCASEAVSTDFKEKGNHIYLLNAGQGKEIPDYKKLIKGWKALEKLIENKQVSSVWPVTKGGIAEGLIKMSVGNKLGFYINTDVDLFDINYGCSIIETPEELDRSIFTKIGTVDDNSYWINGEEIKFEDIEDTYTGRLNDFYPINTKQQKTQIDSRVEHAHAWPQQLEGKKVNVLIPIFRSSNGAEDLRKRFEKEGANVELFQFNGSCQEEIKKSTKALARAIRTTDILAIPSSHTDGYEPNGMSAYIGNILKNPSVMLNVAKMLKRNKLILGINSGFQALVYSGILNWDREKNERPLENNHKFYIHKNESSMYISRYVNTMVANSISPWTKNFSPGQVHQVPISTAQGRFEISEEDYYTLRKNNQIAFQYSNEEGYISYDPYNNPTGSSYSIEGVLSKDGQVLGKICNSERYGQDIAKNIYGDKNQNIFRNAIDYIKGK